MSKHRKEYDKKFKLKAIRFYDESGKTFKKVEQEFGFGIDVLCRLRQELK